VVLVSLSSAKSKARNAGRKQDVASLIKAFKAINIDTGSYPDTGDNYKCVSTACMSVSSSYLPDNGVFAKSLLSYISAIPIDPQDSNRTTGGSQTYGYFYKGGGAPILFWSLEYKADCSPGIVNILGGSTTSCYYLFN